MSGSQLIGRRRIWVEGLTPLLGGSWVVISIVISPLIWVITIGATALITTHDPPSSRTPCLHGFVL